MASQAKDRNYILFISFITTLLSVLIANKWILRGITSFGRVWHFYVNYFDFGFIRRGFVGTILTITGINRLFDNTYINAVFIHTLVVLFLLGIITYFFLKQNPKLDSLTIASVFLSPAFILQASFVTSALDNFLFLIVLFNSLFVKRIYLFCLLIFLGIISHEIFLFTIPAQILCFSIRLNGNTKLSIKKVIRSKPFIFSCLTTLISLALLYFFGKTSMTEYRFNEIMSQNLKNAAFVHDYWSGYFEINSSLQDNIKIGIHSLYNVFHDLQLYSAGILPITYLILVLARILIQPISNNLRFMIILCCFTPLLISFFANEFYRWIGIGSNMAILITLVYSQFYKVEVPRIMSMLILSFVIFAPFGTTADQAVPFQKFIVEKLVFLMK